MVLRTRAVFGVACRDRVWQPYARLGGTLDEIEHRPVPSGTESALASSTVRRGTQLRGIFLGRDGIRPGWLTLLFMVLGGGLTYGLSFVIRHYFVPRPADLQPIAPGSAWLMEGAQVAAVVIATAVLAAIEGKPWLAFGLQGPARRLRFVAGAHPTGHVLLSGGATGPEGSVLAFPVLFVVAALMQAWWGRQKVKTPLANRAD
jgi:hypothetical protein